MASERVNLERALLAAIDDNDLPAADRLIRSGADVNRRGPLPLTALMLAAGRGSTQMVGKLLAAGADVHAVDSTMGASALHFAAQGGVIDIAQLLLDAGAFINLQSATVGLTPLITAIWAKQVPMVRYLLARGAAIEIKTPSRRRHRLGLRRPGRALDGWLHRTRSRGLGSPDSRAAGAAASGRTKPCWPRQTLMSAVQAGDLATVQQLIADGVDVNEKSPVLANGNDGQTPLLVACFLGHGAIARALRRGRSRPAHQRLSARGNAGAQGGLRWSTRRAAGAARARRGRDQRPGAVQWLHRAARCHLARPSRRARRPPRLARGPLRPARPGRTDRRGARPQPRLRRAGRHDQGAEANSGQRPRDRVSAVAALETC